MRPPDSSLCLGMHEAAPFVIACALPVARLHSCDAPTRSHPPQNLCIKALVLPALCLCQARQALVSAALFRATHVEPRPVSAALCRARRVQPGLSSSKVYRLQKAARCVPS
eukprot:364943-Chlamydomonas_euryale.AAC.38